MEENNMAVKCEERQGVDRDLESGRWVVERIKNNV